MTEEGRLTQLARLAAELAPAGRGCSSIELAVPGLDIWYSHAPAPAEPAMFEPRLYIVLQGRKTMTFAARTFEMMPGMFAVSSIGVPFITSVESASPDAPYLGIGLALDPAIIGPLMSDLTHGGQAESPAVDVGRADAHLLQPMERLLAMCATPEDIAVLAPLAIKEVHYRLLKGEVGATVRQLVSSSQRAAQIRKVATLLRQTDGATPTIGELAKRAGMSVTSLYRHFKLVTGYSPIEYGKHLRLIAARSSLSAGTMSVAETADRAGYSSPSQFSREYKRKFGASPRDHRPRSAKASGLSSQASGALRSGS